jgi:putative FmdB family regulatory protein
MPLYDYVCGHCSTVTELNRKISDRDSVESETCPECSTVGQMTRQVGSPLVGYSTTVAGGYGRGAGDGWKEVLKKIHSAPGAKQGFSSFI